MEAEEQKIPASAAKQYPHDAAILSAYAYRELQHHQIPRAKELYEAALAEDRLNADATVNLGVIGGEMHSNACPGAVPRG